MEIPKKGVPVDILFRTLEEFRTGDHDWRSGRTYGYSFDPGEEIREVGEKAYLMFLTENGVDFTVYPSLLRLENSLIAMVARHLNGDEEVVGNFTSGGTESIILAVRTARDYFRQLRPEIKEPEMILPSTAHAAFHKAAQYLGIRVVRVPVDPDSFRADARLIGEAISPATILLVASAPSYAHGVVDPVGEIGQLALEHDLLLHVDACIGGFMLPYFRRLGAPVPDFDFSVPGVTSISMDLHKYAYAPKGASTVLYRNRELRRLQIFVCTRWPGYPLVNNTVQSSKTGGPLAAAWAVMNHIGDDGYLELARLKMEATRTIVDGIEGNDDLYLMTAPDMCLVSFTSDTVNVFHIVDEMNSRGWYVQPALSSEGSKEHIHLTVSASNAPHTEEFLADLNSSVEAARSIQQAEEPTALEGMLATLDLEAMTGEEIKGILNMVGMGGAELPGRIAGISTILNVLPGELREELLLEFVNNLFSPAS